MKLKKYPRESLVLVLIALATLPIFAQLDAQDVTRIGLAESVLTRGTLNIDPYREQTIDLAHTRGHWYSDKAPGISLILLVPVGLLHGVDAIIGRGHEPVLWKRPFRLWLSRVFASGFAFLLLVFLVGRVGEGLAEGTGALCAVVLALGTIAGSLSASMFGHLANTVMLFAGFVLATRAETNRAWLWVGLLAGAAVLFEYPGAIGAIALVGYAAWRSGRRAALAVIAGGIPAAVVLGGYDWLAFGSPLSLSYKYVSKLFSAEQEQGFFGVSFPTLHGLWTVLFDTTGLLVISPILALGTYGLVVLGRQARREAVLAASVASAFIVMTMGYVLPDGGSSPGPRFATAALPFLILGLPFAYRRWKWLTLALAVYSIAIATYDEMTWTLYDGKLQFHGWPQTIYSIARLPVGAGAAAVLVPVTVAALIVTYSAARDHTSVTR